MHAKIRGGIISAVTRAENYIDGYSEEERSLPSYVTNLRTQLSLVTSMREKYIGVQDTIIEQQVSDAKKQAEIVSKEQFLQRCDDLIERIEAFIHDAPNSSSSDSEDTKAGSSTQGDFTRYFLTFMRRSEERHQQQMEMLMGTFNNSGRHNVLLHEKYASGRPPNPASDTSNGKPPTSHGNPTPPPAPTNSGSIVNTCSSVTDHNDMPPRVFLATAVVNVLTDSGQMIPCRILLDGGATVNVVSSNMAARLGLPTFPSRLSICGVNASRSRSNAFTYVTILSRTSSIRFNSKCFILPQVTGSIPSWPVDDSNIHIPQDVALADPQWAVSRPVDMLLCGNHYWASWLNDSIELGPGLPHLKDTVFGYVVVGEQEPIPPPDGLAFSATSLDESLHKFWEAEDLSENVNYTEDEIAAERHFASTYKRDVDGRFIVQLPFREDPRILGESRPLAIRQFLALERKFEKHPKLREAYSEIIRDQLYKQWIEPVHGDPKGPVFYMPHHGVVKESSVSTKLRIVYNASAKSSSGFSLNDILRIGPVIQLDLATILLNFRKHAYAMTADINKMYLQILLHPSHSDFQRFVWRENKSTPIQDFRIKRVCFGVASSPFLATRTLVQVANETKDSYPLASEALKTTFYVDDCLISVKSLEEGRIIQSQLIKVLDSAGFPLTKWVTNHHDLQPASANESNIIQISDETTSALGITWNAKSDHFFFRPPISVDEACNSKRKVMSAIAKLFDPLGLVGPVIIEAKLILQDAHKTKCEWDSVLPDDLIRRWTNYVINLQHLGEILIPRWVSDSLSPSSTELHVFSDASQRAYGVCIYLVTRTVEGDVCSHLLTSKSRIAPLKESTIPKLELRGAHLAAELASKVKEHYKPDAIYYWCDSTIVLYWLQGSPDHYKIFVSNRVRRIQMLSDRTQWRYVPTHCNPADIISRGVTPQQLQDLDLWWHGPSWLTKSRSAWPPEFPPPGPSSEPSSTIMLETIDEEAEMEQSILSKLLSRYSSLTKIQRIIAYGRRFYLPRALKEGLTITPIEMEEALNKLIYMDQQENFPGLADNLRKRGTITLPKWKHLLALAPFVDSDGLIRVGGRLEEAPISYQSKHPVLLPKSVLTKRIIAHEHHHNLHASPTVLLATLRQRYWPLSARNIIRSVVHNCLRCTRTKPRPLQQLMGNLPSQRVTLYRPFQSTGVDYAGPILYRPSVQRGSTARKLGQMKGYIAVFVCMATKAAHLEFVSSLTTEAFLAAFRRFAARRNTPSHMYSDCGTTFEGASRELSKLLRQEQMQKEIKEGTVDCGTTWHFIPARAPHHGGLWEACEIELEHQKLQLKERLIVCLEDGNGGKRGIPRGSNGEMPHGDHEAQLKLSQRKAMPATQRSIKFSKPSIQRRDELGGLGWYVALPKIKSSRGRNVLCVPSQAESVVDDLPLEIGDQTDSRGEPAGSKANYKPFPFPI
ncbi:uncharacterized protein LOC129799799 [Phlebotomus papatasi]|uniref:uncharacterized protein LOC129799799 n=1 Tax=Phlebotomus papatasi TaxID=29031 RepID=UPI0024845EDF|nr:uncharacterized protein LOC129799799 [Phlebotomus papatasi]